MNTPTPLTDTEITLTGAYTCTHHNDQMRAVCPVCRVTALTAERDQLRARAERAEAKRDALSKLKARLINALEHYQNCVIAGGKNPARDAIAAAMKDDRK